MPAPSKVSIAQVAYMMLIVVPSTEVPLGAENHSVVRRRQCVTRAAVSAAVATRCLPQDFSFFFMAAFAAAASMAGVLFGSFGAEK